MKHQPRKRFGQNFLHDPRVIERIVAVVGPRPGDHLLEIGPGQGAITVPLLRAAGELSVVELDRDLIDSLRRRCDGVGTLHVHLGDALKFEPSSLGPRPASLRVVGNLPYNISTPLLFHLMEQLDLIADFHFMLQKEVVDRMGAEPGSRRYGRLSVMTQYFCKVQPLFDVEPGSFRPRPKVHSTFVRLTPERTKTDRICDQARLQQVVRQAFSQRRKTLRNVLAPLFTSAELEGLGIEPGARPETLALDQFVALANHLARNGA